MHVIITGATGFIGGHLTARFDREGIAYTVLTRDPSRARERCPGARDWVRWDPPEVAPDGARLGKPDAVVHLAGAPVAQRWTAAARRAIYDSRVLSSRLLVDALAGLDRPPSVLVSHSAVGFYGPRGDEVLDENAPGGDDFLARLCRDWEEAAGRAAGAGIRVVHPRVGIVLGPDGGALAMMLTPFRLGAGGPIGHGRQWMSWIHVDDVVGLILHAISTGAISGPINATAPEPVTNRDFSRALGRALKRPAILPTPVFALKLLYGDFADILATGQRVVPARALDSGFQFRYPELDAALADAVGRR